MLGRAACISKSALYLYLGGLQKLGFLPISLQTPLLSLHRQPPSFEVLFAPSWVSQEGKPAAAAWLQPHVQSQGLPSSKGLSGVVARIYLNGCKVQLG